MTIEKVLNNNTIVSIDPKTKKEVILVGCGIAFNKKSWTRGWWGKGRKNFYYRK